MPRAVLFLAALLLSSLTFADGQAFTADMLHRSLREGTAIARPIPVATLEQAYAYQDRLVDLSMRDGGARAGYKAALTSSAAQEKFGTDRPVLGTVLKNMLLRDRVSLDKDFAVRPLIEADLMAMVGSDAINDAQTHEEVLAALEGIHPLIELPDLVFEKEVDIHPLWITAINAGAKLAAVGDPVIVRGDTNLIDRLGGVRATVLDKRGNAIASGSSDALMGHPLNVVIWIRDEVASRGARLKRGDVLWLGSLTPPLPVTPGESYQVLYTGLDVYPVSIQVNIRKRLTH